MLLSATAIGQIQTIELNEGEQQQVTLSTGKQTTIRLLSLKEYTEPYFQSADSQLVDAVVRAEVELMINGVTQTIQGGPFQLPVAVNGVAVLVGCTRGFNGGIFTDGLTKDVRLELKDASLPWYEPDRFVHPIRNYRWHASNYHHTYLGVVPNIAKLYYHRGEDRGMIPDLEQTLSMNRGVVLKKPKPEGDGGSNVVWIQDSSGLIVRYVHMNEYTIEPGFQVGDTIGQGQKLGLTGNTYAGHRSPSPHLHVSLHDSANSDHYIHSFPAIVTAYQHSFPGELMPIAGAIRHVYAGEELELDGTKSLAGQGHTIASYEWTFTNGKQATTAKARRRYAQPGTYSEELRITDEQGRWDRDFVEVFVLSKDQQIRPPRAWINYYPIRNIRAGTDVRFLIRYIHLNNITIDYGDGVKQPYTEWSTHRYAQPGHYLVTVKGEDAGAGPGIFHVRVVVGE